MTRIVDRLQNEALSGLKMDDWKVGCCFDEVPPEIAVMIAMLDMAVNPSPKP